MLGIILEASFAFWWIYLAVVTGFALAAWSITRRWLGSAPVWLAGVVIAIVVIALAGPWLIYLFFGRCDSEGGKIATYVWIFLELALAVAATFLTGAVTARLWGGSKLLALGVLVPAGIASTALAYMAFIYFAFSAEQCLL
jgi:hypothetical protein